jgi:hypothetical protein
VLDKYIQGHLWLWQLHSLSGRISNDGHRKYHGLTVHLRIWQLGNTGPNGEPCTARRAVHGSTKLCPVDLQELGWKWRMQNLFKFSRQFWTLSNRCFVFKPVQVFGELLWDNKGGGCTAVLPRCAVEQRLSDSCRTRGEWWKEHRARAAAAACEGVDENSAASACEGVDENARAKIKLVVFVGGTCG